MKQTKKQNKAKQKKRNSMNVAVYMFYVTKTKSHDIVEEKRKS